MSLHLWINAFETSLSPIRFVFSYYLLLLHLECLLCHKVLAWKSTHIRCGTQTRRCEKIKSLTCLFLDDKVPARLNCLLWSSSMGQFTEYEYYEAFGVWSQAWSVIYKDTLCIHFDFRDVHWCSPFGQGHHKCFHTNRVFVSPQRCLSFWSRGPWDDFVAGKLLFLCPSFFFFLFTSCGVIFHIVIIHPVCGKTQEICLSGEHFCVTRALNDRYYPAMPACVVFALCQSLHFPLDNTLFWWHCAPFVHDLIAGPGPNCRVKKFWHTLTLICPDPPLKSKSVCSLLCFAKGGQMAKFSCCKISFYLRCSLELVWSICLPQKGVLIFTYDPLGDWYQTGRAKIPRTGRRQ